MASQMPNVASTILSPVAKSAVSSDAAPSAGRRVDLKFQFPEGRCLRHTFRSSDLVGALYSFVDSEREGRAPYHFASAHPRKIFEERHLTLQAAGIGHQLVLHVETKRS